MAKGITQITGTKCKLGLAGLVAAPCRPLRFRWVSELNRGATDPALAPSPA